MGAKPKMPAVPPMPTPVAATAASLPPAVMPPATPQESPTANRRTDAARALGASQGMNNTNLTGPQGLRLLDDQTQPRSLLGL